MLECKRINWKVFCAVTALVQFASVFKGKRKAVK